MSGPVLRQYGEDADQVSHLLIVARGGEGMRLPFWLACVFFVYMHFLPVCL